MNLPAQGAPLGLNTRYVSTPDPGQVEKAVKGRLKRFELQSSARELLPDERVSWCLRRLSFEKRTVQVWVAEEVQRAHLKNVVVCGSVWHCPVCSAKITERRRVEMSEALIMNREKFTPILVTLTFQHERGDKLENLVKSLARAWRSFRQGRAWLEISREYGFEASVTGSEVTYGMAAGWHPHKHALFFSSLPEEHIDVEKLQRVLSERWQAILGRLSEYAHIQYGVDVRIGDEKAAEYVGKWGLSHELVKSPVKKGKKGLDGVKGYSPFELLDLYGQGHKWAGDLFLEYAGVMKGRKQLVWSHGARQLLGMVEREQTDEELAQAAEQQSYMFVELTFGQYSKVVFAADRGRKGVIGELLEVASRGDPDLFWAWLEQFGVEPNDGQVVQSAYPWLLPQNHGEDPAERERRLARARAEQVAKYKAKKRKWKQRRFYG